MLIVLHSSLCLRRPDYVRTIMITASVTFPTALLTLHKNSISFTKPCWSGALRLSWYILRNSRSLSGRNTVSQRKCNMEQLSRIIGPFLVRLLMPDGEME